MIKIDFESLKVPSSAQMKCYEALNMIEQVINSDAFKSKFMLQRFTQLTNSQVKLSREALLAQLRRPVKIEYSVVSRPGGFWKKFKKATTIGWRNTGTNDIFTYSDKFNDMSTEGLAGHLAHEISHVLGFAHAVSWSKARDSSAPYLIGNWVESMLVMARVKNAKRIVNSDGSNIFL